MKKNKFAALLLAAALPFSRLSVFALADEEQEGPTLDRVTVYQTAVALGSDVIVGADAFDPDGVQSFTLRFAGPDDQTLTVTMKRGIDREDWEKDDDYDRNDRLWDKDQFVGTLSVPATASLGEYVLESATLLDEKGNRSRYLPESRLDDKDDAYLLECSASFKVQRATASPALSACTAVYSPGTRQLTVTVRAKETPAGFFSASFAFKNRTTGHMLYGSVMEKNRQADGSYQVTIDVPVGEPEGVFDLYKVTAIDKLKNSQTYCDTGRDEDLLPMPIHCSFTLAQSVQGDLCPPQLSSLSITGTRTSAKTLDYQLSVAATDDLSGVDHISVRFKNDANGNTVTKTLTKDDRTGSRYVGWLEVDRQEPAGTFTVEDVTLSDAVGNNQSYARPTDATDKNHKLPLPQLLSFHHGSGSTQEDKEGPVLKGITLSKYDVDTGSKLDVTVDAADDQSGLDQAKLRFETRTGHTILVTIDADREGKLEGRIAAFKTGKEGTYRLTRVTLTDKSGNARTYYETPTDGGESLPFQTVLTLHD